MSKCTATAMLACAFGVAACDAAGPLEPEFCADYPCKGMELVSRLSAEQLGLTEGIVIDMWGWTDPVTGTEWALVGHSQGTAFVNLGDPERPVHAAFLPLTQGALPSGFRDIKVYRDHAFIVSDEANHHGMQVVELARLRDITASPSRIEPLTVYDRIQSAHNIAINEEAGFAYVLGANGGEDTCGGGLHMIDIRTPATPVFAGCFADESGGINGPGYTHDAMCVVYRGPDAEHRGREICFLSNEEVLSIADVSDKHAPVALSQATYPRVAYAHQGWLDESHEYLYMNDELDEYHDLVEATRTIVWDVKDLGDPVVAREFMGTTPATDHNLYIVGDLMYQSNYRAGLRVLSIADRENPVEVAFFDPTPDDSNEPGIDGSWSNYPFFGSGIIGLTSMGLESASGGVFFVRLSDRQGAPRLPAKG
ncbi:MAG: choice-of-anchor B family protein [Gemmatimonadota bacterium]|nr:choice-of-anchor B family protein [Gemmatimonadota bacterium]